MSELSQQLMIISRTGIAVFEFNRRQSVNFEDQIPAVAFLVLSNPIAFEDRTAMENGNRPIANFAAPPVLHFSTKTQRPLKQILSGCWQRMMTHARRFPVRSRRPVDAFFFCIRKMSEDLRNINMIQFGVFGLDRNQMHISEPASGARHKSVDMRGRPFGRWKPIECCVNDVVFRVGHFGILDDPGSQLCRSIRQIQFALQKSVHDSRLIQRIHCEGIKALRCTDNYPSGWHAGNPHAARFARWLPSVLEKDDRERTQRYSSRAEESGAWQCCLWLLVASSTKHPPTNKRTYQ